MRRDGCGILLVIARYARKRPNRKHVFVAVASLESAHTFLLISLIQTEHGSQRLEYLRQQIYSSALVFVQQMLEGVFNRQSALSPGERIRLTVELSRI